MTAEDFKKSQLWVGYYEPDDFLEALKFGLDEQQSKAIFEAKNWPDDHFFPINNDAAKAHWFRGKLMAIKLETHIATVLEGYCVVDGFTLDDQAVTYAFFQEKLYPIRTREIATYRNDIKALTQALDEDCITPIVITNLVTGKRWQLES